VNLIAGKKVIKEKEKKRLFWIPTRVMERREKQRKMRASLKKTNQGWGTK